MSRAMQWMYTRPNGETSMEHLVKWQFGVWDIINKDATLTCTLVYKHDLFRHNSCHRGHVAQCLIKTSVRTCLVIDLIKQKFVDLIKKQCLINAAMEDCLAITWDEKNDCMYSYDLFTFYLVLTSDLQPLWRDYRWAYIIGPSMARGDEDRIIPIHQPIDGQLLPPPPYEPYVPQ